MHGNGFSIIEGLVVSMQLANVPQPLDLSDIVRWLGNINNDKEICLNGI